jgi:hypothetical protein
LNESLYPKAYLNAKAPTPPLCQARKRTQALCSWVDFYDYIWSYGSIDWKGKYVLDIGADIGSSALFFLMEGAKYIYLLEKKGITKLYITTLSNNTLP